MKKYYFITYSATSITSGTLIFWNACIDISPLEYILKNSEDSNHTNFALINTLEITEEEFNRYVDEF